MSNHNQRLLVFRDLPKGIAEYVQHRPDYQRLPLKLFANHEGNYDLTIEVQKDQIQMFRRYVEGLIDGYLLAQQPEPVK